MVSHLHTHAGDSWCGNELFCGELFALDMVLSPCRVLHKKYLRCGGFERARRSGLSLPLIFARMGWLRRQGPLF